MGSYQREIMGAGDAESVTPANSNLPLVATYGATKGLLVSSAGTANLMMESGNIVTGMPLQVGYNPLRVKQVRTGGTASGIYALY